MLELLLPGTARSGGVVFGLSLVEDLHVPGGDLHVANLCGNHIKIAVEPATRAAPFVIGEVDGERLVLLKIGRIDSDGD
ncbi:hypothetical protein V6L77_18580 [Pannonibacter sp. Pt2-lr]